MTKAEREEMLTRHAKAMENVRRLRELVETSRAKRLAQGEQR